MRAQRNNFNEIMAENYINKLKCICLNNKLNEAWPACQYNAVLCIVAVHCHNISKYSMGNASLKGEL